MQHPFINDLSDKSLEELQNTISGLMSKLAFAQRTGNRPLINQLLMVLESYKIEHGKKLDELMQKQQIKTKIDIRKDSER